MNKQTHKTCRGCNETLPIWAYLTYKTRGREYVNTYCMECDKARRKVYRKGVANDKPIIPYGDCKILDLFDKLTAQNIQNGIHDWIACLNVRKQGL